MKISVIISNFNQGKYAEKAISSCIDQEYLPYEIIIVDDASTDDSVNQIKSVINKLQSTTNIPLKLIERKSNGGPSPCKNDGIQNASGDIIATLDIDDFYYRNKLSKSVEYFINYPEVAAVYSDYDMLDEKTGRIDREYKLSYDLHLLAQTCIISTNSLISKHIFDEVGYYDPKYFSSFDYDLWMRMARRYMIVHIPESLFCYRIHGGNITITHNQKALQETREIIQRGIR